jgi:hypothetical protein
MKISPKLLELLIILFLGCIPLLWLRPGYLIARSDEFPFWFNPSTTIGNDTYLWSVHNMGNTNTMPSFLPFESIWLVLRSLELSVGLIQILFQVFFSVAAGFSMYFLSKTIYPNFRRVPLFSSVFYMFSFFVLRYRLNIGIASINPPNVILAVLLLGIIFFYYLIAQRDQVRRTLRGVVKLAAVSITVSIWWIVPVLNYYLLSPSSLNPQVNVDAWSWTHARASFLNLFWLNGAWDWRPEYVPYLNSYSNPLLLILTFIPFFLAATALLFKTNKSRFNAYIMLAILSFLFLAKGIHEPLSGLNILLYTYIPGMSMFREPASKFTMALMPFLALLIGYAVHHIVNTKIGKHKPTNLTKATVTTCFILVFIIGSYPLVTNPMETKTPQLPYSSYVKIPDYWYKATDWLNNQPGDYKILITPPDDFYMMPYTWGYYGTEDFIARFIQKPILLTYYAPYRINPETAATLDYLGKTISDNRTDQFKALLDLLNVRYILQRNDVQSNFTGSNILLSRNILSSDQMKTFLTQQPYIHLVQEFGQLCIYEYMGSKPYVYVQSLTSLQQTLIKIENVTTLDRFWDFTLPVDLQEWISLSPQVQWDANVSFGLDGDALKVELWNSTYGWKVVNSPFLPAQYGDTYQVQVDIRGQNASGVHIKTVEFDAGKNYLTGTLSAGVGDGTFDWKHVVFMVEATNQSTKYLQVQIWHGEVTDKPLPNIVWIKNFKIQGYIVLNSTGIDLLFQNATQNNPATIISYERVNPTRMALSVNATQPFILAVSEALDQSWTAHANGKQYKPTPLYLDIQGFYINETGLLKITIEYEPQLWFYYGSAISLTALILCTLYMSKDKIKIIYKNYIKKRDP